MANRHKATVNLKDCEYEQVFDEGHRPGYNYWKITVPFSLIPDDLKTRAAIDMDIIGETKTMAFTLGLKNSAKDRWFISRDYSIACDGFADSYNSFVDIGYAIYIDRSK